MKRSGALLLFWWAAAGMATAAPDPAEKPPRERVGARRSPPARPLAVAAAKTVIMMAAKQQEAAARELHRAVGAQLSDAPVLLTLHWVESLGKDLRQELLAARRLAKGTGVSVVFWCDLVGSDDVYLFLSEPGGGRLLVRAVPQGKTNARAESVAIIIGASVRAFLQAGSRAFPAGGATAAAPGPRPPAAKGQGSVSGSGEVGLRGPSGRQPMAGRPIGHPGARLAGSTPARVSYGFPRPRRPPRLSLELGYAIDTYDRGNAPVHGARLALAWHLGRRFSLFVSYRVLQGISGSSESAEVSLQRNPIAVGGILRRRFGRWTLGGALALVADYVTSTARAAPGTGVILERSGAQGDWHLLASAGLVGGIEVVDRLWIELGLGVECALYSISYSVRVPDVDGYRDEKILRPWVVQPYGVLGLRLEVL